MTLTVTLDIIMRLSSQKQAAVHGVSATPSMAICTFPGFDGRQLCPFDPKGLKVPKGPKEPLDPPQKAQKAAKPGEHVQLFKVGYDQKRKFYTAEL